MEIIWGIFDDNQDPVTGGAASTSVKIRRGSDGYLYDWNDGAFKNSGWTTLSATLTEIDATNLAGYYKKDVTESGWTDGWYQVFVRYTGTPKRNGDIEFLLEGGKIIEVHVADNLDAAVSARPTLSQIEASTVLAKQAKIDFIEKWILNRLVEDPPGTWKLYDDDDTTVLRTWTVSGTTRSKAV